MRHFATALDRGALTCPRGTVPLKSRSYYSPLLSTPKSKYTIECTIECTIERTIECTIGASSPDSVQNNVFFSFFFFFFGGFLTSGWPPIVDRRSSKKRYYFGQPLVNQWSTNGRPVDWRRRWYIRWYIRWYVVHGIFPIKTSMLGLCVRTRYR